MWTFDIWAEGYMRNEERGFATFHGTFAATTFQRACDLCFTSDPLYDPAKRTYDGCYLFEDENIARCSFG